MLVERIQPRSVLVWGLFVGVCAFAGLLAGINPLLAIAFWGSAAYALIAMSSLNAALMIFLGVSFLEFSPLLSDAAGITKVMGALLALGCIAKIASAQRVPARQFVSDHPFISFVIVAFLAWCALSFVWSKDVGSAFAYFQRYLLVLALFVIVYTAVETRRQLLTVAIVVLGGAVVTACYGMLSPPSVENAERLASTVGNANVLATILVAGLAFAGALAYGYRRRPLAVMLAASAAAVCLAAFLLTGSRSGVIALGVILLLAVFVAGRGRRGPVLAIAVGLVTVIGAYFVAFAPDDIRDRIVTSSLGEQPANEGRVTLWKVGWRMVVDRPATGVGIGNFQATSIEYLLEPGQTARSDQVIDEPQVAHNIYLHTVAELGIPGLAMLLTILGFCLWCALRAARTFAALGDEAMEMIARGLFLALAGILAADFFASEQYNKILWLLLGLAPAMLAISRSARNDSEDGAERISRA